MVDTSRLTALLELDEQGEYLVEQLSRALVNRRKRRLLIARLHEINDDSITHEEEIIITQSEAEVLRIIQAARKPCTTTEVQARAVGESLKRYRQHASATLNSLTSKGLLGKVRGQGREVYFAPAREAVKLALTQLGQTPDNYDPQRICEITDLQYAIVLEAAEDMKNPFQ